MIKHIVLWKTKDGVKNETLEAIKKELVNLPNIIPGLIEMKFNITNLLSSTHNVCLESLHDSIDALKHYQVDPAHIEVGKKLKELVYDRVCTDYEV